MDKGILAKGDQPVRSNSLGNQKKVTRTRKTKTQTTGKTDTLNPIIGILTPEFNPIFQEMLGWMKEVQALADQLQTISVNDKRREKLEIDLEWRLTQIEVRSHAIVEQMYELMPD